MRSDLDRTIDQVKSITAGEDTREFGVVSGENNLSMVRSR